MEDIILGYDGSDCAKAALALATETAKAMGDRVVVVWTIEAHHTGGEVKDYEDALKERRPPVSRPSGCWCTATARRARCRSWPTSGRRGSSSSEPTARARSRA